MIDKSSYPLFLSRVWHISDTGYLVWRGIEGGVKHTIRFHRLVINAPDDLIVDHINRNKLDNRRKNLRFCSFRENIHNSDKYERAKGYYFDNYKKRWTVDFTRIGIRSVYVETEEDAKRYIQDALAGKRPNRVFTRRKSLGGAKMTSKDREKVSKMFDSGIKRYQIAKIMGLSPSTIGRLLAGKTWRDSTP